MTLLSGRAASLTWVDWGGLINCGVLSLTSLTITVTFRNKTERGYVCNLTKAKEITRRVLCICEPSFSSFLYYIKEVPPYFYCRLVDFPKMPIKLVVSKAGKLKGLHRQVIPSSFVFQCTKMSLIFKVEIKWN